MPSISLIKTHTLASQSATIDFTSIPAYQDLMMKLSLRSTVALDNEYFNMTMNSDGGNVYFKYTQYYNGFNGTSTYDTQAWTSQPVMYLYQTSGANAPTGMFSNHDVYIFGSSNNEYKPVLEESNSLDAASVSDSLRMTTSSSMLWRTAGAGVPINRLTITAASGSFVVGSMVSLYGIKTS
jgi:hypothetical protein